MTPSNTSSDLSHATQPAACIYQATLCINPIPLPAYECLFKVFPFDVPDLHAGLDMCILHNSPLKEFLPTDNDSMTCKCKTRSGKQKGAMCPRRARREELRS